MGRWIPGLLVAAVLLSVGLLGSGISAGAPGPSSAPLRVAPFQNTTGPLSYHAALYVNASAPTGSLSPGVQVAAELRIQVPAYTVTMGAGQVRIPNSIADFPTTTGTLRIYLSAANFTIYDNNPVQVIAGPAVRWSTAESFNASTLILMSTQGLSVTASWPYGEFGLQFSWRWVMTAVDGTPSQGIWSPWASVTPPRIANLATSPAHTWIIGSPYQLCFNGPVGGRTFAVHVSIANPVEQFTTSTFAVPVSYGSIYCWNNSLPSNLTAQQAFIHVWEFANVTFQLYDFPIQLGNNNSNETALAAFLGSGWVPVLIGAAVVIGIIVALEVAVLGARQRRSTGASEQTPPR